jgi:hypothetical protein
MLRPHRIGDQLFDFQPQQLIAGVAEHLLRCLIQQGDVPLLIDFQDTVGSRFQKVAEALFGPGLGGDNLTADRRLRRLRIQTR